MTEELQAIRDVTGCRGGAPACCAGLHLIKHAAWRTLERGGQFVLLGSAPDPKVSNPVRCGVCVTADYSPCSSSAMHAFVKGAIGHI